MEIAATLMRGGTSKCWIFDGRDLPAGPDELEELLVPLFGAADPRQLDGVGGGTSVTSKAAVVTPSAVPGFDADYLFAQVAVGERRVEWGSNCGNCATAVALWAVQHGLVPETEGGTEVRLRNLNTGSAVTARVGVEGSGESAEVPGVVGSGVPVELRFLSPEGSGEGGMWPTGVRKELLAVEGLRVEASMIDAGAPVVLVAAESLGVPGAAGERELLQYVPMLRAIRRSAALAMGLAQPGGPFPDAVPKVGIAGPAVAYRTSLGVERSAEDYDLSVRMLSMNAPHPTIGLTSAVAVSLLASEEGTVPSEILGGLFPGRLAIGTLGGVLRTRTDRVDGVTSVVLSRAARRLAESTLFLQEAGVRRAG